MPHEDPQLASLLALARHALGRDGDEVDIDAILDLGRQVAGAGLRPMAPVSAFIWGLASPHRDAEEVIAAMRAALPSPALPADRKEDPAAWRQFVTSACGRLGIDPDQVPVSELLDSTREIAHASRRPMAPVGAYLIGRSHTLDGRGVTELAAALVAALSDAPEHRQNS